MKFIQILWILIINIKKISFISIFITIFCKIFLQLRCILNSHKPFTKKFCDISHLFKLFTFQYFLRICLHVQKNFFFFFFFLQFCNFSILHASYWENKMVLTMVLTIIYGIHSCSFRYADLMFLSRSQTKICVPNKFATRQRFLDLEFTRLTLGTQFV